jgi:hypothetical protein
VEEREFYKVPAGVRSARCHRCKRKLEPGDLYYMTDDDSWLFCKSCASGREAPRGPRRVLPAEHERAPLHKKVTMAEQYG